MILHITNGEGESVTVRGRDSITVFAANSVTIRVTAKADDMPVVSQRSSGGDVAARHGDRDVASCVIGILPAIQRLSSYHPECWSY